MSEGRRRRGSPCTSVEWGCSGTEAGFPISGEIVTRASLFSAGLEQVSPGPEVPKKWESEEALESPSLNWCSRICLTHDCLPTFALNIREATENYPN